VVDVDIAQEMTVPPFSTVRKADKGTRKREHKEYSGEGKQEDVNVPDKVEVVEWEGCWGMLGRRGDIGHGGNGGGDDDVGERHVDDVKEEEERVLKEGSEKRM
jgi:hypothetical protein